MKDTKNTEAPTPQPHIPILLLPPILSPDNKPIEKTKIITDKKRNRERDR
jgi:hypothetical protein